MGAGVTAFRACTRHSSCVLVLLLATATATATPLRAQTKTEAKQSAEAKQSSDSQGVLPITNYGGDWSSRLALTGDWDGLRQRWADHGFTVDVNWTTYGQGVDSGGFNEGWEFGGQLDTVFHADLERMDVLYGGLFTMRVESRYGENANKDSGLILPVNTQASYPTNRFSDTGVPIAITALNYTQYFTDEIGVIAGKVQTEDGDPNEFAGGRGRAQFMNSAFVQSPATALTGPYSTLTAGVLWVPSETASVSSTVMNLFDSSTTTGFDELGNGGGWATEADFQWEGDLPGGMNIGGNYGFGADFTQILGNLIVTPGGGSPLLQVSTTWCVYWSA